MFNTYETTMIVWKHSSEMTCCVSSCKWDTTAE